MIAKKKALIGGSIGIILFIITSIVNVTSNAMPILISLRYIVLNAFLGVFFGIGIPFGWPITRIILSKILGISKSVSIFSIFSENRSALFWVCVLSPILLAFTAFIMVFPGFLIGVYKVTKEVIQDRKTKQLEK